MTIKKLLTEDWIKKDRRFKIENNHIQEISVIWSREDITGEAKHMRVKLSEDNIDEIMFYLVDKHDAETGLNWYAIQDAIREIIR